MDVDVDVDTDVDVDLDTDVVRVIVCFIGIRYRGGCTSIF